MSRPTSKDVARHAGVSQPTVSRVLNGNSRVAPATREKVLAVIDELGYEPNAVARGLVTSHSHVVGLVVSDVTNPFYPQFVEMTSQRLAQRGLGMLFHVARDVESATYESMLRRQQVEGLIFTGALLDSKVVRRLVGRRFPVVLANRYVDDLDCDVVVSDNRRGAASLAQHLLELGHRRIAVLGGREDTSTSRDRTEAFIETAARYGDGKVSVTLQNAGYDVDMALVAGLELLAQRTPPTAIFCVNDYMAFGILNAAKRLGIDVPGQVSVVGYDAIDMAAWDCFRLTTVRQPVADMATASVELLHRRLAEPDCAPQRVLFANEMVVGETSGPAPAVRRRRTAAAT